MSKQNLTKEEVIHLAHLAKLDLAEDEIKKYQKQLSETIDYVKNLSQIGTETAHELSGNAQKNTSFEDKIANERLLTQNQALANAKKKKDHYFVVERILR